MTNREEIIGYDVEAVESWINENTEGLEPPFEWVQLEGGHSNLTYALTDPNGSRAVVRRPPMGELLPKAHDMGREFSIIRPRANRCPGADCLRILRECRSNWRPLLRDEPS